MMRVLLSADTDNATDLIYCAFRIHSNGKERTLWQVYASRSLLPPSTTAAAAAAAAGFLSLPFSGRLSHVAGTYVAQGATQAMTSGWLCYVTT
jgi:hypothetical protein